METRLLPSSDDNDNIFSAPLSNPWTEIMVNNQNIPVTGTVKLCIPFVSCPAVLLST
jgi:hypothetical protein